MKKLYVLLILFLMGFMSNSNAQDLQWAKVFNPPNSGENKYINTRTHCIDLRENIYTAGNFSNAIDFNMGGTPYLVSSSQNNEGYIAKYDKNGSVIFVQRLKGSFATIYNIITDNKGALYVTGSLSNQTYFDPEGVNLPMPPGGFLAKYDTSGNFIYARKIGNWGRNLYIDNDQNVYLCGFYKEGDDMDPGEEVLHLPAYGETDIFFAKFTSGGNLVFAKGIGSNRNDTGGNDYDCNIAVTSSGEIILSGTITGWSMDFDPGEGTEIRSTGSHAGYIARYTSEGELINVGVIENINYSYIHDMHLDASDNIYITGEFNGTLDFNFDPNVATRLSSKGMQDLYFAKYDPSLNLIFAKGTGGAETDRGYSIVLDGLGFINVIGDFYKNADLDPSSVTRNYGSGTNTYHFFIAKYNTEGNFIDANYLVGSIAPTPVTISPSGTICLSGWLKGDIDFDFSDEINILYRNSSNSAFLVQYKQSPELKLWHNETVNAGANINIGTSEIGASAEIKEFYIKNTGDWKLDFTQTPAITLSGPALSDYQVDLSLLDTYVTLGDSVKFTVTFTPSEVGERMAQLTIHNNTIQTPDFSINLTGSGTPVTSITHASDKKIVLYPNPSSDGYITIKSSDSLTEVTITNSIGQREVFHSDSFTTSLKGILTLVIKTTSNVYVDKSVYNS